MSNLDEKFIKYFAAFLIFFAVSNRIFDFKLTLSDNFFTQALTGTLSGIGNGTASIDGPPLVFFLTGIKADKAKFKNTLASYFLVIGIISILLLMVDGNYTVDILINSSYVAVFAIVGVLSGILIGKHINESNFNKIVIVLLISLGISLFI